MTPKHGPAFEIWPPAGSIAEPEWKMPGWGSTIWRGMRGVCPHCGKAPIFDGYLKVHPLCAACAAPLGDMPADDAPPYIAMLVVLHISGAFIITCFKLHYTPGLVMAGFLLVVVAGLCMVALRLAKGAVIGILLKLGLKREALNG